MAQSLAKVILHLVFSTKNHKPIIPEKVLPDLHAYIAGTCRELNSVVFKVGGVKDHIHIACSLPRTTTISKLLEEIKKPSSAWIKTKNSALNSFSWQAGYAAFSVSQSDLPVLVNYIKDQQEHHRKKTYREEVLEFLQKYEVDYDEKYLWE